jgi:hypothetical protein
MGCEKTWRRLHSTLISVRDENVKSGKPVFSPDYDSRGKFI